MSASWPPSGGRQAVHTLDVRERRPPPARCIQLGADHLHAAQASGMVPVFVTIRR